jgi:BlaR1 peptidase M56
LPPHQLDALILHELAHIRRLDTFTNILLVLAETVLFYHPAVWWVSRRVRLEREHCCDDFAVAMCGDAAMYVEALTSLKSSRGLPVLALAASGGKLKDRVARLLDVPARSRKISPFAVMGLLLLCAVATTAATARSGKDDVAPPRAHVPARVAAQMTVPKVEDVFIAPAQTDAGYRRQAAVQKPRANEVPPPAPVPQDDAAQATVLATAQDVNERDASAQPADQQADTGAPASVAEPGPAPTDSGIERIVVTARKWLGDDPVAAIHAFVNSYTNPATLTVAEIARWKGAICARTYGLARPEDEDFVTRRVEDIARDTGLKVKTGPCHLSIEIIFTPQPQDFLNRVRARNASFWDQNLLRPIPGCAIRFRPGTPPPRATFLAA